MTCRLCSQLRTVYILILPFALIELGHLMPVAVTVTAWALLSIEERGCVVCDLTSNSTPKWMLYSTPKWSLCSRNPSSQQPCRPFFPAAIDFWLLNCSRWLKMVQSPILFSEITMSVADGVACCFRMQSILCKEIGHTLEDPFNSPTQCLVLLWCLLILFFWLLPASYICARCVAMHPCSFAYFFP